MTKSTAVLVVKKSESVEVLLDRFHPLRELTPPTTATADLSCGLGLRGMLTLVVLDERRRAIPRAKVSLTPDHSVIRLAAQAMTQAKRPSDALRRSTGSSVQSRRSEVATTAPSCQFRNRTLLRRVNRRFRRTSSTMNQRIVTETLYETCPRDRARSRESMHFPLSLAITISPA